MKYKNKHKKLVTDYETQKRKHIEKLANSMLDNDEKMLKFKSKQINNNFLDLF